MSGKFWGEVERGERSPTLEKVFGMAKALNIQVHALVQIEREQYDNAMLRKKIESLLDGSNAKQLKRIYCYLLDTIDSK